MTVQEAKNKIRRIVKSNTNYTQVHQLADPKGEVDVKSLILDLEIFIEYLLKQKS